MRRIALSAIDWLAVVFAAAVLLPRNLALAAEETVVEGAAVVIERSAADWLPLLVALGIFWIVLIGLVTVLVMKIREADRLFRMRR